MQAKLKPSELSYLLRTLGAEKAVGVNNAALFPADEAARDALLAQGFAALQEDGWLVKQNGSFATNADVMLLTAVIAAPEFTIMLTSNLPDGKRQTITYYQAQGIIVEQLYTSEEQYLLTRLDSLGEVIERLCLALGIPQEQLEQETAVTLNTEAFEQAVEQAKSGNPSSLTNLLAAAGLPAAEAGQLAARIPRLRPAGNVEIAAFAGGQVRGLNNIIALKETDETAWTILPGSQPETIIFQTVDAPSFSRLIRRAVDS
ncbi:MAG TPA: hypothetical protein ENJ93_00910 [Chloroflexi bacterium]|nr:hypothetical protein [Chloroflexota bacterium]